MKRLYTILFLLLTTIFSFGFTNDATTCHSEETEPHHCCHESEEEAPHKDCTSDCCVQSATISILGEGLELKDNKTKQVFKNADKKLVTVPTKTVETDLKLTAFRLKCNDKPLVNEPSFSLSRKQSWLI